MLLFAKTIFAGKQLANKKDLHLELHSTDS
jgi:hypothetical protein